MIPKNKPYRNKSYLKFIDGQPCLICGRPSTHHHIRKLRWGSGIGTKSHDLCAIPLCHECHTKEHQRPFVKDVEYAIIDLLMRYINEVLIK